MRPGNMMRLRGIPSAAFFAVVLMALLTGCSISNHLVSGHVHRSVAMPENGSLAVSESTGTIRVQAWDKPLVAVDAITYGSDAPALSQVRIGVKSTRDSVTVSTTYTGSGPFTRPGDVNFMIHAPANAGLDLSSHAGSIVVRGSRAGIKARTWAGEIDVQMAYVGGAQQIALSAASGQITLRIPPSSSATVNTHAIIGSNTSDFPTSTIGSGAATISMHVITGEVTLESGGVTAPDDSRLPELKIQRTGHRLTYGMRLNS